MKCLLFLLLCLVIVSGAVEKEKKDPCTQPFGKKGMCKARIPRWGLHKNSGECRMFYYGGCGGNENNFESKSECEERCKA